jgi:integrase
VADYTSKKAEHGLGTVRQVLNKKGELIGWQALLPRELSTPPKGCKNPKKYKEPVGPRQETEEAARRILIAAIDELRSPRLLRHGLSVAYYVDAEIKARRQAARRKYESDARANKAVATWRSIYRKWIEPEAFVALPPAAVQKSDLQALIDYLRDEAEGPKGDPLSGHFIRNVAALLKASFARAPGLEANPAASLKLPKKGDPDVRYLDLAAQRAFFGSDVDELDRVMVGCGMGAGLRVSELLAIEEADVRLDDHDPHLIVRYGGPDHAPTKGDRVRRVELHEPGLGFWRLWMAKHRAEGRMVFAGPKGGYQKHWPERFPTWAAVAGVDRLSSHIMRHTYAVAMLSGTWGYEPKTLEFIQHQLGHAERSTTERYYAAYEAGTWRREVRAMRGVEQIRREPITAAELLQTEAGASAGASPIAEVAFLACKSVNGSQTPSLTQSPTNADKTALSGASAHQAIEQGERALAAAANGEPTAARQLIEALANTLRVLREVAAVGTPADEVANG